MARKTSAKNTKEPVRLREKELANGVRSLYLDIYVYGKRSYEFLKLYLIPETNPQAKVQNENTMRAANTIKLNRILEITNNKAGLKNTSIRAKILLKDWMETFRQAQEQKGVKDQKLIHNTVHALTAYNINVAMRDVNRDYIIGLTNFLRNDYRSPRGKKLKDYSVINYLGCLRNALNMAVREDVIADNPIMKLSAQDKVKAPESQREYLTVEKFNSLKRQTAHTHTSNRPFSLPAIQGCGAAMSDPSPGARLSRTEKSTDCILSCSRQSALSTSHCQRKPCNGCLREVTRQTMN